MRVATILVLALGVAPATGATAPPVSLSPPVISGAAVEGQTLTADNGTWLPARPTPP